MSFSLSTKKNKLMQNEKSVLKWRLLVAFAKCSYFYRAFYCMQENLQHYFYGFAQPSLCIRPWYGTERSWLTHKDKKRCNESWNKPVLFNKTLSELSFHMKNWPFKQKWPAEFLHRKETKCIGAYVVITLLFHDTLRLN